MKGCIYARESSDDTKTAPPISSQIEVGTRLFAEHGHELVETYADEGYSGGDWNRPDLTEMKKDAPLGLFDFVWVFAQDRLARETELFRNIYRSMHDSNVRIYVGSNFDEIKMETTGDMAKHTVTALADEMFRKSTSDKVRGAYLHRKKIADETKTVLHWGRIAAPQELIELARSLRAQHPDWSLRKIAAELPPYPLKLRAGEDAPRMRRVSHVWVHSVVSQTPPSVS